jgi:predicted phage terminase large subunit-like protein
LLNSIPSPAAIDAEWTARAEIQLAAYIRKAWPVIEPATAYLHNWHIDAISEFLEAVTAGQITRLLINMPPRYMKSICVSVMWPTWEWITRPDTRWLFASYSGSLSTKHSVDRRTLIQSDWYQARWGSRYSLTTDQNVKTEYQNDQRGVMVATSVGGSATGKGGTRIVVDDPHNPQEALSDVQRASAITFFDQTLSTRLDDKKHGVIVVVMQRLHAADLSAHVLEQGYTHLNLPAEAPTRTIVTLPRSGQTIIREPGAILWPEREGPPELARAKGALGSYGYAGQYDQSPSPPVGGVFQRGWWRFYRQAPARFDEQIQSWDMAFKGLTDSDYVVGQVWGKVGAEKYLLDQVRGQMSFTETCHAVETLSAKWPRATAKLVEDKANGTAVIDTLRRKVAGLIAVEPEGGKQARAAAISPEVEAGNVYLPDPALAPWVHDFIEEAAAFPRGLHDDQVDGMTQALLRWITTVPPPPAQTTAPRPVATGYR